MALSDSMFLFEIVLEELKSFVDTKQFIIKSEFADIFLLELKNPSEVEAQPKRKKATKSKTKVKYAKDSLEMKPKVQTGQSVLFASNVDLLMSYMMKYPMEISLWSRSEPNERIGSTLIPWNPSFVQFLARLYKSEDPPPVIVNDFHNVFDEFSSKRMAAIKLIIKLSHFKDRFQTRFRQVPEKNTTYAGFDTKAAKISSALKKNIPPILENPGTIKTIYSGGKQKKLSRKSKSRKSKNNKNPVKVPEEIDAKKKVSSHHIDIDIDIDNKLNEVPLKSPSSWMDKSLVSFVKSESDIEKTKRINLLESKSCSSIKRFNTLNYIFGDRRGPFGSRIYTVGYFTVESPKSNPSKSGSNSSRSSKSGKSSNESLDKGAAQGKFKFKLCASDCPAKKTAKHAKSECSLDLPAEASAFTTVTKCKELKCVYKKERDPDSFPRDDRVLLELQSLKEPCCVTTTVKEEIVGNISAKLKVGDDPCFCACDCIFGIGKKTTYCTTCGGYEVVGEDMAGRAQFQMPVPCPIYHKVADKKGLKTGSTSGSESKKKFGKTESEKDRKKGKKKRKDDRFKFNYGYKGIPPQIGHSQCAMPCSGTLNNVPKSMGWLWTADNIPGLKFRPQWKPGAINKFVVRLLKMARNPGEVSKKRRRDTGKKKRPLKRPLLVVHKKDGEYCITMETMKPYSKPRALNQQPYEDKPVLTYTIGRTEEENRERRKKKERAQRRIEREQREFIESAFRNACQDICWKTYLQALGITPDTEDPECICYPALPGPEHTNLDASCSCSEHEVSFGSDTDEDEWILEFTPPTAHFDPTYKGKKVFKADRETQYTYLDYRVKLLDRFGNPVPRFFKSQDGKQQCSDLGGFWSPDHHWMEINIDGYIAPDGRWAPLQFIGPSGEMVDSDTGKFQATNGNWLVVGVDGWIDANNKWRFYPRPRNMPKQQKKPRFAAAKKGAGDRKDQPKNQEKSEPSFSCFGDVSPVALSKMGIVGHGPDKKLLYKAIKDLVARGRKDLKLPEVSRVPKSPASRKGKRTPRSGMSDSRTALENPKCRHPTPSEKGIVIDARGHKTYFRLKDSKNWRPRERLHHLEEQGKSLSSFHRPCLHSFTDSATMRMQQRERLIRMAAGLPSENTYSQSHSASMHYKRA